MCKVTTRGGGGVRERGQQNAAGVRVRRVVVRVELSCKNAVNGNRNPARWCGGVAVNNGSVCVL